MFKILLIMILFVLGVFAQPPLCQQYCTKPPYYYRATLNKCCQIPWVQDQCGIPGESQLIDPGSTGNCVV